MDMIGQDDGFMNLNNFSFINFIYFLITYDSYFIQYHFPVHHITKIMTTILCIDGDEISTHGPIIVRTKTW